MKNLARIAFPFIGVFGLPIAALAAPSITLHPYDVPAEVGVPYQWEANAAYVGVHDSTGADVLSWGVYTDDTYTDPVDAGPCVQDPSFGVDSDTGQAWNTPGGGCFYYDGDGVYGGPDEGVPPGSDDVQFHYLAPLSGTETLYVQACYYYNDFEDSVCGQSTSPVIPPTPGPTTTHIETVEPPQGDVIATSTAATIGATGYINENDYASSSISVVLSWRNNGCSSNALVGPAYSSALGGVQVPCVQGTLTFPIDSAGDFDVSSTTALLQIGVYTLNTSIQNKEKVGFWSNVYHFLFDSITGDQPPGSGTLAATTTSFTVGTTTAYDILAASVASSSAAFLGATYSECSIDFPISWGNVQNCINAFFRGPMDYIYGLLQNNVYTFLHAAPWGYATRTVEILVGSNATTTLPSIAVSVPTGLPGAGATIDFTPWTPISNAVSKIDTTRVSTIDGSPLEKFEFYWNTMWYIVFAFWFIKKLMGSFEAGDFGTEGREHYGQTGGIRGRLGRNAQEFTKHSRRKLFGHYKITKGSMGQDVYR